MWPKTWRWTSTSGGPLHESTTTRCNQGRQLRQLCHESGDGSDHRYWCCAGQMQDVRSEWPPQGSSPPSRAGRAVVVLVPWRTAVTHSSRVLLALLVSPLTILTWPTKPCANSILFLFPQLPCCRAHGAFIVVCLHSPCDPSAVFVLHTVALHDASIFSFLRLPYYFIIGAPRSESEWRRWSWGGIRPVRACCVLCQLSDEVSMSWFVGWLI